MSSARHIVVAINPSAAFGKNARVGDAVVAQVVAAGHAVTVCRERDYASLRKATAQAIKKADALLVVGGDGMVSLGINLVAKTTLPLGVIPAGTGNDFARATHLPVGDPDAAVQHFLAALERDSKLALAKTRAEQAKAASQRAQAERERARAEASAAAAAAEAARLALANSKLQLERERLRAKALRDADDIEDDAREDADRIHAAALKAGNLIMGFDFGFPVNPFINVPPASGPQNPKTPLLK
jgi:hypothetical protein